MSEAKPCDRLLSTPAVAAMADCDRDTVLRAVKAGKIPALAVYGVGGVIKSYVVWESDAKDWEPPRNPGPRPKNA